MITPVFLDAERKATGGPGLGQNAEKALEIAAEVIVAKTILFLDIDGVLHPEPTDESLAFCQRKLLWELLEACPNLYVVITSTWRLRYSLSDMVRFILNGNTHGLEDRFLGVTPEFPELKFCYRGREEECLAWLQESGHKGPWIALDDVAANFEFGSPQLVLSDYRTGLTADTIARVLSRLS